MFLSAVCFTHCHTQHSPKDNHLYTEPLLNSTLLIITLCYGQSFSIAVAYSTYILIWLVNRQVSHCFFGWGWQWPFSLPGPLWKKWMSSGGTWGCRCCGPPGRSRSCESRKWKWSWPHPHPGCCCPQPLRCWLWCWGSCWTKNWTWRPLVTANEMYYFTQLSPWRRRMLKLGFDL